MGLLAIPCIAVAGRVGFPLANVRTVLRPAVPAHPFLVIDSAGDVEPDDDVTRAVRLRRGFGVEHRERHRRRRVRSRGVERLLRRERDNRGEHDRGNDSTNHRASR